MQSRSGIIMSSTSNSDHLSKRMRGCPAINTDITHARGHLITRRRLWRPRPFAFACHDQLVSTRWSRWSSPMNDRASMRRGSGKPTLLWPLPSQGDKGSRTQRIGIRGIAGKLTPRLRALTMTTTVTATQATGSVRKISKTPPAQWQTMGFSLWSTSALNPMHATMACHQVIPERTLTASPQLSVEQIHGSSSTTRETLSQSRFRRLATADTLRSHGRSHSPGLMDRDRKSLEETARLELEAGLKAVHGTSLVPEPSTPTTQAS